MTEASTGLRGRKKSQTRAELRRVAVRLARESGPDGVTVEEICAAAEVSPRTFFNYFDTKDEAFLGVDQDHLEAIADGIADRPASEAPLTAVEHVLAGVIGHTAGSQVWHEQLVLLREHPVLVARMNASNRATEAAVSEGVARRTGRPASDPYVRMVAASARAAFRVALTIWLEQPETLDPREMLAVVVGHLGNGLAPPAG